MSDDGTADSADLPAHARLTQQVLDLDPYARETAIWRLLRDLPADDLVEALTVVNRDRRTEAVRARHAGGGTQEQVEQKAHELRVADAARHQVRADHRADPPPTVSLADLLDEPDEPVAYRIDQLWPVDGRVVLAAQNKSGKTTLVGNVMRSLVDGDAFLDRYAVAPVGKVVLLDDEMSRSRVRAWLQDQEIANTSAVDVVILRGALSSFDILDPVVRADWVDRIRGANVMVFDCLRPALDALGLDENQDAGRFLVALDELCRAAGVHELMLVHHMGHANERSRGSSRIEDWPDAKWKLVKADPDDERSARYFSAYGRDVDEPEMQLAYDPFTRRLAVDGAGPSRKEVRSVQAEEGVLAYVAAHPGCTGRQMEGQSDGAPGVGGNAGSIRGAIKALVAKGHLRVEAGPRGAKLHYVVDFGHELI
ncbi:AAA family ATPase [uncultured Nocardioides sp.]|uniref:AAA family ATPase n=1 Tax=uncultured Nocardioides sp. TaxID=198441 RepID=UPI0026031950|nr:AAA family ATPase [uncultured Nocardioides sp.]